MRVKGCSAASPYTIVGSWTLKGGVSMIVRGPEPNSKTTSDRRSLLFPVITVRQFSSWGTHQSTRTAGRSPPWNPEGRLSGLTKPLDSTCPPAITAPSSPSLGAAVSHRRDPGLCPSTLLPHGVTKVPFCNKQLSDFSPIHMPRVVCIVTNARELGSLRIILYLPFLGGCIRFASSALFLHLRSAYTFSFPIFHSY